MCSGLNIFSKGFSYPLVPKTLPKILQCAPQSLGKLCMWPPSLFATPFTYDIDMNTLIMAALTTVHKPPLITQRQKTRLSPVSFIRPDCSVIILRPQDVLRSFTPLMRVEASHGEEEELLLILNRLIKCRVIDQLLWKGRYVYFEITNRVPVKEFYSGWTCRGAHTRTQYAYARFPPTKLSATSADSVGVVYSKTTGATVKLQK